MIEDVGTGEKIDIMDTEHIWCVGVVEIKIITKSRKPLLYIHYEVRLESCLRNSYRDGIEDSMSTSFSTPREWLLWEPTPIEGTSLATPTAPTRTCWLVTWFTSLCRKRREDSMTSLSIESRRMIKFWLKKTRPAIDWARSLESEIRS